VLSDLGLTELRQYRPEVAEPADFGGHEAGETRHFLAQLGFLAGLAG
jgi:hypothetical protein